MATKKSNARLGRDQAKLKNVLKQKGYQGGKLPKGKEAHHVKPVAKGGKTTKGNIKVVSKTKHRAIHKNRRRAGKI